MRSDPLRRTAVPNACIQGKDETTRVDMVLAFRHEGPAAYEVARLSKIGQPISDIAKKTLDDKLGMIRTKIIARVGAKYAAAAISAYALYNQDNDEFLEPSEVDQMVGEGNAISKKY